MAFKLDLAHDRTANNPNIVNNTILRTTNWQPRFDKYGVMHIFCQANDMKIEELEAIKNELDEHGIEYRIRKEKSEAGIRSYILISGPAAAALFNQGLFDPSPLPTPEVVEENAALTTDNELDTPAKEGNTDAGGVHRILFLVRMALNSIRQ